MIAYPLAYYPLYSFLCWKVFMALHYAICRPVRKSTNTNILIISAGTTATPAYSGMTRPLDVVWI
nr:MAG TPA: hypothetical protein [Bacteriophage sp.]